jgi:hypothetical protein
MKTLEKRYDDLVQQTPEAQPVIDTVRGSLANIVKLCRASSKLNIDGAKWMKFMEEAEARIAACQQVDGKELFTALLECYTGTQLRMLNSLQFSTEEDTPRTNPMPLNLFNLFHWSNNQKDHSSCLRKSK